MQKLRPYLAVIVSLLFHLAAAPALADNPSGSMAGEATFVEGELLIKFRDHVGHENRDKKHKTHSSEKVRRLKHTNVDHIRLKRGLSVEDAISLYQADPDVLYAEPNYIWTAFATPMDTKFSQMWNLDNTGQTGGIPDADIDAPEAWDITTGSQDVVVAVIDTGVDYTHEDLAANMWRNPGEISGNGVDDDGNGYIDDIHGWDAITCADLNAGKCLSYKLPDGDPMDVSGHGTEVAGTLGAVGNNDKGVTGVNWSAGIMACRWMSDNGKGLSSDALGCLDYVKTMKDRGVNIVATNNSWGGGKFSEALYRAIEDQGDILFVSAAGNDGIDLDASPVYPSSYALPNIISVAATNNRDGLASMLNMKTSNYGRRTVHVGAPGAGINTTRPGNVYTVTTGTSIAAPHVSGLAALLEAQDPGRTWQAIRNLILAGGDNRPSMSGVTATGKRINAYGSLACVGRTAFSALEFPSFYSAGVPVTLSALSLDCENPVGPVTVLTSAGEEVILTDDGVPPDAVAGDGTFSASWTPVSDYDSLTFSSAAGSEYIPSAFAILSDETLPPARVNTFYSHTPTVAGGLPPYSWSFSYGMLPPGMNLSSSTGRISGTPVTTGGYSFDLTVQDAESNTATMRVTLPVSNGADLVVTSLVGPDTASYGGNAWIDVTVKNQGTGSSGQTDVEISLADDPDVQGDCERLFTLYPISPGQQTTLQIAYPVQAACGGSKYWVAWADYWPRVIETNEDNNLLTGNQVTVLAPDYEVVPGSVNGPGSINGTQQSFTTSVLVKNVGGAVSDASQVRVFLSVSPNYLSVPPTGFLGSAFFSSLSPGQEQSIDVPCSVLAGTPAGQYFLWAQADPDNGTPEIDGANNAAPGNPVLYTNDVLPLADFTGFPTSGEAPLAVDFSDTSTGGTARTWSWSFGDGSPERNEQHPSHTYQDPGIYTVELTVGNGAGSDTVRKIDYITVTVPANVPVADAGPDKTGETGRAVRFDGRGSTDDQGIDLYEWDFDSDGTVDSTKARTAYVYDVPGTYIATLTVTDVEGLQGSDTATVTITSATDSPPVANAGPDQVVNDGDSVTLNGEASFDDVGITRYRWDFESDGVYDSSDMIANHVYPGPGTYTATLNVSDTARQGDEDTVVITVLGPPEGNTIAITRARYVVKKSQLDVEATSSYGAAAALEVVGYGPMTWNGAENVWEGLYYEPAGAPKTVTVTGPEGSATANVKVGKK